MRFQVPQFIDIEDKVFGPFTFKQFVYIAGGVGLCFVLLRIFPRFLAIIFIIPVASFSLALAFYRVNNKPFIQMVEAVLRYFIGARLYIWKRADKETAKGPALPESYRQLNIPKTGNSRLKDLTWSLDARKGEEQK